jgi:hypothetical protein
MKNNPNFNETDVYNQILRDKEQRLNMIRQADKLNRLYDLLLYAMTNKNKSLVLLIEYLWKEKQVITPESDIGELNKYMLPQYHKGMNKLLGEYEASGKSIYTKGL